MSNQVAQVTKPFFGAGNFPLPILRTVFGSSKNIAVTTTPGAAQQIHTSDFDRAVRIWAVGCPLIYVFGASGVAVPNANTDGFVGQDQFIETFMTSAENHIRVAAASGSGNCRIELLR